MEMSLLQTAIAEIKSEIEQTIRLQPIRVKLQKWTTGQWKAEFPWKERK